EEAMRAFKIGGAHGAIMPKNLDWSVESAGAAWPDYPQGARLPDWRTAHAHLLAHGYPTRVRNPSPNHASLNHSAPRPLLRFQF
ncbi:MAG: hypothetical protein AB7O04_09570, partial [Hyphomonadaceae bacterium]